MGRLRAKTRMLQKAKNSTDVSSSPTRFARMKVTKSISKEMRAVRKVSCSNRAKQTLKTYHLLEAEEEVMDEVGPQFQISFPTTSDDNTEQSNLYLDCEWQQEWVIEQLFCGDGSTIGANETRRRFVKGRFYACGSGKGNKEDFREVEEDSFGFQHVQGDVVYLHARSITTRAKLLFGSTIRTARILTNTLNEDNSGGFTDACLAYIRENIGVSLRLIVPGRRPSCSRSQHFWISELGHNLMYGTRFNCIIDACVNIVYCAYLFRTKSEKDSKESASLALNCFRSHEEPLYSVASVTPVFHKMKLDLDVKRVPAQLYKPSCIAAASGTNFYLVRMYVEKKTDHIIAVDATRKVIIDSEEPFPLRLCVESLLCRGGGKELNPKGIEVRKVFFSRPYSAL